ncbi:MAG: CPBP family intramembrane metalloprotease [Clostridia bacterium]|nr:CPBP family intramembrane metalloprotease [Clostridia bacterium]
MKKLYEKNEVGFALVWIGLYVVLMNVGMQVCGGFDDLASKTVGSLLVPVLFGAALAAASTLWIVRNGLQEKYGLCRFRGDGRAFLFFIPVLLMSVTNLKNGVGLTAPLVLTLLMMANKAVAGYVEEIIFRGFLFRAMEKSGVRSAVIVSGVTFGVGHIVNLANTEDTLGVLLQVAYAVVIGLMFTLIVWKGGSLWPCILSHMFVNGSSCFALQQGPFTDLVNAAFGQPGDAAVQAVGAVLLMLVTGAYALWLWLRVPALPTKA